MHRTALNILCVEDDAEIREIVALSLKLDDAISLRTAASGDEALRLLVSGGCHPDCILLDVRLPDVEGPMVLAEIRALPETSAVPIIYMTAAQLGDGRASLGGQGAIGVIAKPFDPTTLAMQIRTMLAAAA